MSLVDIQRADFEAGPLRDQVQMLPGRVTDQDAGKPSGENQDRTQRLPRR